MYNVLQQVRTALFAVKRLFHTAIDRNIHQIIAKCTLLLLLRSQPQDDLEQKNIKISRAGILSDWEPVQRKLTDSVNSNCDSPSVCHHHDKRDQSFLSCHVTRHHHHHQCHHYDH